MVRLKKHKTGWLTGGCETVSGKLANLRSGAGSPCLPGNSPEVRSSSRPRPLRLHASRGRTVHPVHKKTLQPGGWRVWFSESVDKPGSVVDDHSSATAVASCLKRPTRTHRGPRLTGSYLVLLRVGFTIAAPVTSRAVRSYRTFSPLPNQNRGQTPV